MTKKRNLNLEQISNYQDQNLHSNYQTQYSNNLQHNQPNNQQNSFQNNPNQDSFKEQIIAGLKSGKGLTGKDGIFSGMVKEVLETMLAEELNQHLTGERKNLGNDFDNRRNGYNSKTIKTKDSAFVLDAPRDRNSSFEPQIIQKNQTILTEELDNKIIALYGFGMGYRDISQHIEDIYWN